MESEDFEHVETHGGRTIPDLTIKNEPIDELLLPEVKLFESSSDGDPVGSGKSKCGEIFSINKGHYILICAFCKDEFDNMRGFGVHMRNKHESDSSNVATSESTTPPTLTTSDKLQPQQSKVEAENDHSVGNVFNNLLDAEKTDPAPKNEIQSASKDVSLGESIEDLENDEDDEDYADLESLKQSDEESSEPESSDEDQKKGKRESQSLKCDSCNRRYKTKKTLYRHQKNTGCKQRSIVVNPEFYCKICNRQLKTKKTYIRHQRIHEARIKKEIEDTADPHQDPSLYCEICNRYFKTKSNLRTHAERHDTIPVALQEDPEFFKCKFCDEPCTDIASRKQHESTHSGEHPYICKICPKSFATIYKKNIHLALHTGERPHQCPHCPNAYLTRRDVLRHITYRHLNVRRFKCEFCDKSCYRKTELAIHMRRHTGEKPYVCEDCGNSFAALSQLKSHQLRHTQTKNFKCDQCGRLFYSSTSLKDHQASHSDAKPFGCDVCGRRFPRAKALKKHKKLHSDIKAYVCNICGKAYAQDSGLYAHKKSHGLFSNPQGTQFSVPLT